MPHDESSFLELTRRIGIDWTATLGDLKRRHGLRRWFDFKDVIDVPVGQLTPSLAGPFHVDYRPDDDPWPPRFYLKDLIAENDVTAQHARLTRELEERLGPSTRQPWVDATVNTWRIGLFEIEISTITRGTMSRRNPPYERHPELWRCTTLRMRATHFSFAPDQSLERYAALPEVVTVALRGDPTTEWFAPLIRRNPDSLRERVSRGCFSVRVDPATGDILFSVEDLSMLLRRSDVGRIHLVRTKRGRGPAFATLSFDYLPFSDGRLPREMSLCRVDGDKSLDEVAGRVARTAGVKLGVDTRIDD